MKKVVNFSVHKNNRQQRERKLSRKQMISSVKGLAQSDCVDGFYFVSWNSEGFYRDVLHDPKAIVGRNRLSSYVGGSAQRLVNQIDLED